MKILVTGGCGFIGSHLVDKLIESGHDVTVLDNLSKGKKEYLNPAAKLAVGDIRDLDDIKRAIRGCSAVFHLAALAEVGADPDLDYQINFLGSKNVFSIAKLINAKVIFTSSASVYGNSGTREDSICNPISQYGKSKLKAEKLCPEAFILRLFNVYGPRGKGVINSFCKKITRYEDITIYGDGLQTRDYVYVSDVVSALTLGLEKTGTYNIGTGVETNLLDVIEIIRSITRCRPRTNFTLPKESDIRRSKADITKIKQLGWEPKIPVIEGIKLTLESMKT